MKSYRRITSAVDLKALHVEAKAAGKLEVGVSKGNILYIWDESRDTIKTITTDEAAVRLGLTTDQISQIIATGGEVVFEEPIEITEDIDILDEIDPGLEETQEPVFVELVEPDPLPETVNDELPTVETLEAPENTEEKAERVEQIKIEWKVAFQEYVEEIAAATERFKNKVK